MAAPYFNSHYLSPVAQKDYEPATSNSGSALNDCPRRSSVAFGMEVQQTTANKYLNTSSPYDKSFHNPFSDYRFPKVLVRVLYHRAPEHREPFGLSNKIRAQQSDDNILYTSQSGLRIDRVWSMAVEANSPSHSINANHSPLDATLKDTAVNGSSGMERSAPPISSVVDNTSQKANEQSRKRKAYRQSEKRKAYLEAYRQSEKGQAARKAYERSEKGKACRKAYRQSKKGKAYRKAYLQSDRGKATCMAYRQSDKYRAYQKDYQKAYQKAYNEAFKNTGDREQAKIAGKQAAAFIRSSHKAKNSELEAISISSLTSCLWGWI